jgi:hypothetical protein
MTSGTFTTTQQAAGSIPGSQQHKSSNRPSCALLRWVSMGSSHPKRFHATKTFTKHVLSKTRGYFRNCRTAAEIGKRKIALLRTHETCEANVQNFVLGPGVGPLPASRFCFAPGHVTARYDPTSPFQDQLPILPSSRSRSWGADCRRPNYVAQALISSSRNQP